jgi:hypothetical protein
MSSLNAMTMNIKDGPRLESWSVVRCTLFNKDIHLWPNPIITTFYVFPIFPLLSTASCIRTIEFRIINHFSTNRATVQHELVDFCGQAMEDPNQGILTEGEGSLQLSS